MRQANLSNNSMFTQDESYIKWKLFLEGDDRAYSWIYTHYIQVLYNYGLQITPDSEIVKDCIQDVFVKIYKAKKKLTVPQNPKVYLMIALKITSIILSIKNDCKKTMLSVYTKQKSSLLLKTNSLIRKPGMKK